MSAHPYRQALAQVSLVARTGRVRRILPTFLEADGPHVPRGTLCSVETVGQAGRSSSKAIAQVVSVGRDSVVLVPFESDLATFSGARVEAWRGDALAPVGDHFKGRVVDALGQPLDGKAAVVAHAHRPLAGAPTQPLTRTSPKRVLETGIRAIDVLLTLAIGQRVGIFAPGGVGKTTLVTQLANQAACDHCILCLVGERGREVESLWSSGLNAEVKAKTTVVAATSDQAAVMRIRAVDQALALAEYWRDDGRDVVLIIDSVTRYAMALREVGLAAGEPPAARGYTPSVFSAIPKAVERCGALKAGGSISAIMTVLSETEDNDDPICELMKSVLDGHVILSRRLAEQGHFPAIDVSRSVSRLARSVTEASHRQAAEDALALLSTYESSRMLIETGAYSAGATPAVDRAIRRRPALMAMLRQDQLERVSFDQGLGALTKALQEQAA